MAIRQPTTYLASEDNRQEERYRATRAVALLTGDADKCAEILDYLGLDAREGLTPPQEKTS